MKIFSASHSRCVLLVIFATFVSAKASAGALISDPAEKLSISKKRAEPMGTAVGGAGNTTPVVNDMTITQKISCWQNGELIFEHAVVTPKDKVTDIRLLHNPTKNTDMIAMDFKNAFCFIK